MRNTIAALALLLATTSTHAGWEAVDGGATVIPDTTNSTILAVMLHCLEGPALDVYSLEDGPVLPQDDRTVEADYFYKKGAVRGLVDGVAFPLSAAGSDIAVVLFSEGTEAEGYLAPLDPAFIKALRAGSVLELGFDVTPATGPDGSAFETWAKFSIGGTAETLEKAVACL